MYKQEPTHRLLQQWNNLYAEYEYILQERQGKGVWWNTEFKGDIEWANRQAEYHECEIQLLDTKHAMADSRMSSPVNKL